LKAKLIFETPHMRSIGHVESAEYRHTAVRDVTVRISQGKWRNVK